ncbi:MAG: hypothetical protein LBD38_00495 [Streptococcaceae bacterium]|jgi:hypothetical protein|nr:hypothetical protein [Streptococcaceae bacterium]
MKKALSTLLCILTLLLSTAFIFYELNHENDMLSNLGDSKESTAFFVKEASIDPEEEQIGLKKIADNLDATILRTDTVQEGDRLTIYKSGIYKGNFYKEITPLLSKGKIPKNDTEILATFDTKKAKQVGNIRDLFHDQRLVVQSLADFYQNNKGTVIGNYTLDVSVEKKEEALQQLASLFHTDVQDLLQSSYGKGVSEGTIFLLSIIIAIIVAMTFIVTSIFYPISKLKEIGVMKLIGFSNMKIWQKLNGKLFIPQWFVFLFIIVGCVLSIPDYSMSVFIKQLGIQVGITFLSFIISLVPLITVKRLKISNLLKKSFDFKYSLYGSYVMKFLVFMGLIFALPFISVHIQDLNTTLQAKQLYENEAKYDTLSHFIYQGDEFADSLQRGKKLENKIVDLYENLADEIGMQYNSIATLNIPFIPKNSLYVQGDINFVKSLNLAPTHEVEKAFHTKGTVYLLPESLKGNTQQVKDLHEELTESEGNTSATDFFYKESKEKFFSRDMTVVLEGKMTYENPIIRCLKPSDIERSSFIMNSANANPLRVLATKENEEKIKKQVIQSGLEKNEVRFQSILYTGYAKEMEIMKSSIIVLIFIILLTLGVSVISSYYIVLILLVSKQKEMVVSKLLGYDLFQRYKNEIFYFTSLYVFGLIETIVLSKSLLTTLIYFVIVGLDLSVIFLLFRNAERKSTNGLLKGEE